MSPATYAARLHTALRDEIDQIDRILGARVVELADVERRQLATVANRLELAAADIRETYPTIPARYSNRS